MSDLGHSKTPLTQGASGVQVGTNTYCLRLRIGHLCNGSYSWGDWCAKIATTHAVGSKAAMIVQLRQVGSQGTHRARATIGLQVRKHCLPAAYIVAGSACAYVIRLGQRYNLLGNMANVGAAMGRGRRLRGCRLRCGYNGGCYGAAGAGVTVCHVCFTLVAWVCAVLPYQAQQ